MPTFYEGDPLAVVRQTLTAEQYAQAAVLAESHRSIWNRRGVRAAAALTVAALAFSCIPLYRYQYATAWIPLADRMFGRPFGRLVFSGYSRKTSANAKAVFEQNRFWQEPCQISLYRDSVCCDTLMKNQRLLERL